MTYSEMDYGNKSEDEKSMPRPIFSVTETDDPVFFNVIKKFVIALWEKAGKEQNAQREIAKRLIRDEGFTDDAVIAYTGLNVDEVKNLRVQD